MGGEERVARARGRRPAHRARPVDRLLDAGTFREIGVAGGRVEYDEAGDIKGYTPSNFVTGRGLHRRPAGGRRRATTSRCAAARRTARSATRWAGAERSARELRLPVVRLVDGTGGGGSVQTNATLRRSYVPANPDWDVSVELLSQVPVVAAALGPVAGLGAARVAASHFSVMVRAPAAVRRGTAGGAPRTRRAMSTRRNSAARTSTRTAAARWTTKSRRGRSVRADPALPLVPAERPCGRCRRAKPRTTTGAPRRGAAQRSRANGARRTTCAAIVSLIVDAARSSRWAATSAVRCSPASRGSTGFPSA